MPGGPVDVFCVAFDMVGQGTGTGKMFEYTLSGSRRWGTLIGGDGNVGQFQPAASAATGAFYLSSLVSSEGYRLRRYNSNTGTQTWSYPGQAGPPTNSLTQPTVGPDSTIYIMRNLGQVHAVSPDGSTRWIHSTSFVFDAPVASPSNNVIVVGGRLTYGQPGFVKGLAPDTGALLWTIALPNESGVNMVPFSRPWFSPDGRRAYITTTLPGSSAGGYLYAIDLVTPCAADFNRSGRVDSQDFFDFIERFFAGDAEFNGLDGTDSQDYFDFLEAFFTVC